MAKTIKQKMNCPSCNTEVEFEIWSKLEMPYDEEQHKKVLENRFFRTKCPNCERMIPAIYNCEYNDLEHKFLIWVIPKLFDADKMRILAFNQRLESDSNLRLAQGGYRYRIVRTDNDLREKVLIFEEELDDRFIEMMKLVYVPAIKEKVGEECKILGIYFDKNAEGKYQWIALLDRVKPMIFPIDMAIYEDMKKKYWDVAQENTPIGIIPVEVSWAMHTLECYEKTKGEETSAN